MPAPAPAIATGSIVPWGGATFSAGELSPLTLDKVRDLARMFDQHRVDANWCFIRPSQLAELMRPLEPGEIVFDEWTEESDDEEDSDDL